MKNNLIITLQKEWFKIPPKKTRNLVSYIPRRLAAIIKSTRSHTKYYTNKNFLSRKSKQLLTNLFFVVIDLDNLAYFVIMQV